MHKSVSIQIQLPCRCLHGTDQFVSHPKQAQQLSIVKIKQVSPNTSGNCAKSDTNLGLYQSATPNHLPNLTKPAPWPMPCVLTLIPTTLRVPKLDFVQKLEK